MHQLQRSWVRSQHPSAQWNLRGGRWSSAEFCTEKKTEKKRLIYVRKDKKFNRNIPPSMHPLGDTPCLAYLLQYSIAPPSQAQIPAYFSKSPFISSSLQSISSSIFLLFTLFFTWTSPPLPLSFLPFSGVTSLFPSVFFSCRILYFRFYFEVRLQFLQCFSFLKLTLIKKALCAPWCRMA